MQSQKNSKDRITIWSSDNSDKHNNSNNTVPIFTTPREREAEKLLFTMWVDQSQGYWSHKTSNSSTRRCNDGDEIYEKEGMEVTSGEESCRNRFLETSNSSSINCRGHEIHGSRSQETRKSTSNNRGHRGRRLSLTSCSSSCNYGVYVDRSGSRLQYTSHYSSINKGKTVYVEGIGTYRSQTSHYSSHN